MGWWGGRAVVVDRVITWVVFLGARWYHFLARLKTTTILEHLSTATLVPPRPRRREQAKTLHHHILSLYLSPKPLPPHGQPNQQRLPTSSSPSQEPILSI